MDIDYASERANALVRAYIIESYRSAHPDHHLATCGQMTVEEADARDGSYGCDTGCEYVRFEAVLTCPHDEREEYEYGQFGELSYLIEDLEREADRGESGGGE